MKSSTADKLTRSSEGKFTPGSKYQQYSPVELPNRQWPNRVISKAPIWCSVDLRDGNQALVNPMDISQKLEMFSLLTEIGFKEIEIGFPSASETEFKFIRKLIEEDHIPSDVLPQVLCQARSHLIERTFESLIGAKRAIFHLYNSTSELQRRVVFKSDKAGIVDIAVNATKQIKDLADRSETEITFQYSPESFTGTELDFALEICHAVMDVWEPTSKRRLILNLPATVEMSTPNVYADQIEWFISTVKSRESIILSLHPHNDRGTAVAAAELALMAGGDRVEGTLFGNGERTGNVDIITLALNLYTQGVDPGLNLSKINRIIDISERCTEIPVHARHPYAGQLVFTAFSGSHQDAIRKGIAARSESNRELWEVPYLPIDPSDIGRQYEPIIRINSQSGKGGVAFVMESEFGCELPKAMHPEFSAVIQKITDQTGKEIPSADVWNAFAKEYLDLTDPIKLAEIRVAASISDPDITESCLTVTFDGARKELRGKGNGPIDACKKALEVLSKGEFKLRSYFEHAIGVGSDTKAISYIALESVNGAVRWGAGIDSNIERSSIKALVSALNRLMVV